MKKAFLVAGLGYGDEGKGATVDYLTWKHSAGLIVRYNGGSQAGHNVVTPDGRWHTFQQFGAGMFHPGVRTHLSRFMLINPMNMMREEEHLRSVGIKDAWERTSVDPRALIITPFHRELNRLGANGIPNTCGQGVGLCRWMHLEYGDQVLFAGDLLDEREARIKLRFIRDTAIEVAHQSKLAIPDDTRGTLLKPNDESSIDLCWQWYRDWREMVRIRVLTGMLYHEVIVFEGAQGVLLDEKYGEEGFNTWTNTTFDNAIELLEERAYEGEIIKVGVIRSYHTRHGAGPFPGEDRNFYFPEPHNEDTGFQGNFRRGPFNVNLFCKALNIVNDVDWLAVNHIDQYPLVHNLAALIGPGQKIIFGHGLTYNDRKESDGLP